jgi:hypothetical protein
MRSHALNARVCDLFILKRMENRILNTADVAIPENYTFADIAGKKTKQITVTAKNPEKNEV